METFRNVLSGIQFILIFAQIYSVYNMLKQEREMLMHAKRMVALSDHLEKLIERVKTNE